MDRVKDKTALITGAASGLGEASALLLAKEGARIVVADINEIRGERVVKKITEDGGKAIFIKLDVSNEAEWEDAIAKTLSEFKKLDVLVNNAGIQYVKELEDTPLEDWRRLMSICLDGVFLGTKHAIRAMRKSGGGSIINISSVVGIVGTVDSTSAYCAAKGGVRAFTKAAALECSKAGRNYNIRVNSIHPGAMETPMIAGMLNDKVIRETIEKAHPIGTLGKPADIAYGVLYLASDESKMVTGAEMVIDGGWTAW
ncbi:MAG: glucose 1-dehydrogenase [Deltaproteobacteria bacterium]|nr:glucose 1-dehydrogenase [Deltaproteobacteria bacterium]